MFETKMAEKPLKEEIDESDDDSLNVELIPAIYVIYEDAARSQIFFDELATRGLPYVKWNVTNGCLPLDKDPPPGVFWCRVSPSASNRNHNRSIAYTRDLLHWLERHGSYLINSSSSFELEVSKARQILACQFVGLKHPYSVLAAADITGMNFLVDSCFEKAEPFYIKPNIGGSGTKVQCAASKNAFFSSAQKNLVIIPNDSVMILQKDCSGNLKPCEKNSRTLYRAEFVSNSGIPSFQYLMKVTAYSGTVTLCPCDDGKVKGMAAEFDIIKDPTSVMSRKEWRSFILKSTKLMKDEGLGVAAIEFHIIDEEPYVFDININNNYSEIAEKRAEVVSGVDATVSMLAWCLQNYEDGPKPKYVIDTESESSDSEPDSIGTASHIDVSAHAIGVQSITDI